MSSLGEMHAIVTVLSCLLSSTNYLGIVRQARVERMSVTIQSPATMRLLCLL